jgi:hypothetical protein
MSMNELFGAAGSKPKLITTYTSGTGTYVPTEDNARCFIRRLGAGGGGGAGNSSGAGSGGGAGALVDSMQRVPIAGIAYAVGAAGVGASNVVGTNGSATRVGSIAAAGGKGGTRQAASTTAGADGAYLITGDTATGNFGLLNGVSGGAGGAGSATAANNKGFAPGSTTASTSVGNVNATGQSTGAVNAGGGGDSAFGIGGNGVQNGTGGNASGYGAGGGGSSGTGATGGNGSGGYIEIWDFGA